MTAVLLPLFGSIAFTGAGLLFREAATGELQTFYISPVGTVTGNAVVAGLHLNVTKWTNETTFSAHYISRIQAYPTSPLFMRIADNGANRICSISPDGQYWYAIHTIGRTDFLTADEVGFGVYSSDNNSQNAAVTLLSWVQG
jgi:hypothetical protein